MTLGPSKSKILWTGRRSTFELVLQSVNSFDAKPMKNDESHDEK